MNPVGPCSGHGSKAHERTQKAAQQAMKTRIAFQSGETYALRFLAHHRAVIDLVVGFVEIAGEISAALVRQRS